MSKTTQVELRPKTWLCPFAVYFKVSVARWNEQGTEYHNETQSSSLVPLMLTTSLYYRGCLAPP